METQGHEKSKALHDYAEQYFKNNGWYNKVTQYRKDNEWNFVDYSIWMSTDKDKTPATVFVTLHMVQDDESLGVMFGLGGVESGFFVYLRDTKEIQAMLENAIHLQKMARYVMNPSNY